MSTKSFITLFMAVFFITACSSQNTTVKNLNATDFEKQITQNSVQLVDVRTPEEFKEKIDNNEFIEWEEVYAGTHYGTLRAEVERIWAKGKAVIFDIDVEGGLNLKNQFGNKALAVFVMPPSIKILEERLHSRSTDSKESIARRIAKAEKELKTAELFDTFILNENLDEACLKSEEVVKEFLGI